MAKKKLDLVLENVTIEAVAAEGKSLAHVDGAVVFVEFAVPGDIVNVRITKKKRTIWKAISWIWSNHRHRDLNLSVSILEFAEDANGSLSPTKCSCRQNSSRYGTSS